MKLLFFSYNKANLFINLTLLIVLAFITALTSCHKENIQDGSIFEAVAEYRIFYEEQMLKSGTKGHPNVPGRSPQWEKATIKNWYRGCAAVAPLDYDKNYFIRTSSSPYSMNLGATSFLMVNKGKDGSMQGEIVYLIPDGQTNQSDKGRKSRFSGTIVTENLQGEFLTAYVCQSDGKVFNYGNSDTTASLKNANSIESLECWIYEVWQKTSIDGGETWSEPTLISSQMECYSFSDVNSAAYAYEYYELGGGGGGNESSTSQSFRPLSADETQNLENVRIEISVDCATKKVIDEVWNGLSFNVEGSISYPAHYDPATNTITFRSSSDINSNAILEELFHAYQNTVYPDGTCQYNFGTPGFTNIEFEAKVFKDIYSKLYGGMTSGNIGFPTLFFAEYEAWTINIANNGFTPALMEQYNTMLGYFNEYNSYYGGYLLDGFGSPNAIIQSKLGCN
jgi:hypothetical protein